MVEWGCGLFVGAFCGRGKTSFQYHTGTQSPVLSYPSITLEYCQAGDEDSSGPSEALKTTWRNHWIFAGITDTIAWSPLPLPSFKKLGQKEAYPDKPDDDGRTPLLFTAEKVHQGVVEILLEREEATPDKPDKDAPTLLSFTAQGGHEGVVKIVLEREEVSPDKPENYRHTPIWYAAQSGHEGVVALLQSRKAVAPSHLKPRKYLLVQVPAPSLLEHIHHGGRL